MFIYFVEGRDEFGEFLQQEAALGFLVGIRRVESSLGELVVNVVRVDETLHDELAPVPDHRDRAPGLLQEPLGLVLQVDVHHVEWNLLGQQSQDGPLGVRTEPEAVTDKKYHNTLWW